MTKFKGIEFESIEKKYELPNFIDYISEETNLTKRTIIKILENIENLNLIFNDPQGFISSVILIINETLSRFLVNGIKYTPINDWYRMEQFEDITTYEDLILLVNHSVYEGVIWQSNIEYNFAKVLDRMLNVRLY